MLDTVTAVYEVFKRYVSASDLRDAAEDVLNVLIDHDFSHDELKEAFSGEKEMVNALKAYDEEFAWEDDEDFVDEEAYDDWNNDE